MKDETITVLPQSPPLRATFFFDNPGGGNDGTSRALIVGWVCERNEQHGDEWYPLVLEAYGSEAVNEWRAGSMTNGGQVEDWNCAPYVLRNRPFVVDELGTEERHGHHSN